VVFDAVFANFHESFWCLHIFCDTKTSVKVTDNQNAKTKLLIVIWFIVCENVPVINLADKMFTWR